MIKSLLFYFVLTLFVDGEPKWQVHHSFSTQEDCLGALRILTVDSLDMMLTGDCGGVKA